MKNKTTKFEKLVFSFRNAIESAIENNEKGEFFRKFPTGQCGNTSDLLAQYLIDNGIGPITYVCGTYYGYSIEENCSHAWLNVNGLVVDITCDQFKNYDEPLKCDIPIYIGPMTEYYQLFEVNPGGEFEHIGIEGSWLNYLELMRLYETILKYIN